jgi:hypothetical protein
MVDVPPLHTEGSEKEKWVTSNDTPSWGIDGAVTVITTNGIIDGDGCGDGDADTVGNGDGDADSLRYTRSKALVADNINAPEALNVVALARTPTLRTGNRPDSVRFDASHTGATNNTSNVRAGATSDTRQITGVLTDTLPSVLNVA